MFDLCDFTIDMADLREVFRRTSFEELFYTGETGRDIASFFRDSSCMECTHRELCTRFTDRLRSDDTDWRTDLDEIIAGQVHTVAALADTFVRLTYEHAADWDKIHVRSDDRVEERSVDHIARLSKDRSCVICEFV